ncbi:hypothetical protein [Moheibacter sediminis]|uniref:Uncharacterized protein n=1 Tax=Moheibacter sediminis TaxID=1434700 RepID=A0A1W2AQQ8_9FLAO|nr:hypothetical protein [Moheibacter sediminis]SMC62870.1 hypothetical protein SAMN06296427_1053 [Moheibacter sediminis]
MGKKRRIFGGIIFIQILIIIITGGILGYKEKNRANEIPSISSNPDSGHQTYILKRK